MEFLKIKQRIGSYLVFEFTPHNPHDVITGDQIWSDGASVEICEFVDSDILHDFIGNIENKAEFNSALVSCGIFG